MTIVSLLAVNAVVLVAAFLAMWLICWRIKDVTPVDSFWAFGMVILAWATLLQTGAPTPRRLLLVALCTAWGLRLGGHLLWRWRGHGPDRRYVSMLGKAQAEHGWGFGQASLRLVFAIQAPLLFIVCLPVQLGQVGLTPDLGPIAILGAAISLIGLAFESIGDWQLVQFKKDPANAGKVLNTGLWRYTRHPNYFGDACMWWGLYLIAAETMPGLWAIPGPALLTWTLMKWSGAPTVEGRMRKTRPDYVAYIETTSGFLPWPPKRPA